MNIETNRERPAHVKRQLLASLREIAALSCIAAFHTKQFVITNSAELQACQAENHFSLNVGIYGMESRKVACRISVKIVISSGCCKFVKNLGYKNENHISLGWQNN